MRNRNRETGIGEQDGRKGKDETEIEGQEGREGEGRVMDGMDSNLRNRKRVTGSEGQQQGLEARKRKGGTGSEGQEGRERKRWTGCEKEEARDRKGGRGKYGQDV